MIGFPMSDTLQQLLAHAPVITDGAWGTQLQGLGLPSGDCPDEWNLSHPERVERVAASYVAAGSRVILTNTFRSNRISLEGFGLASQVTEINKAGAAISRKAAGTNAKVFASMGPTGKILMMGEITEEEVNAAFTEQAIALASGGADAVVVETMSDLSEAAIAVRAAKAAGLPVVASMVFDSGKDHDRTMMGSTPEDIAEELAAAGADVIGANCGLGMEGYVPIARRLRAATGLPIWIKPNAGLPELVDGHILYHTTPHEFAQQALSLRAAGVSFIGGCCGTSPEFITALAATLNK
jgi:5-methyltetrahydrofolate--homocysteine methyltransferase